MRIQSIILIVAAALVLGALGVLFVKVQRSPDSSVPAEKLAAASARHKAQNRGGPASASARKSAPTPPKSLERKPPSTRQKSFADRAKVGDRRGDAPTEMTEEMIARIDEAQTSYRKREYQAALDQAVDILQQLPENRSMLRIAVRSACAVGEERKAREYFGKLRKREQRYMISHCKRYGVEVE